MLVEDLMEEMGPATQAASFIIQAFPYFHLVKLVQTGGGEDFLVSAACHDPPDST